MKHAHEGLEVTELDEPSGIVKVSVCKDSGLLPTSLCTGDPRGNRVYEELFVEGTEPTTTCDVHVLANINRLNNKLATPGTPRFLTRKAIYIKKDHPNPATADYYMVLPSSYDPTTSSYENHSNTSTENNDANINTNENNTDSVNNSNPNIQDGTATDSTEPPIDTLPPPVTESNPVITPIN